MMDVDNIVWCCILLAAVGLLVFGVLWWLGERLNVSGYWLDNELIVHLQQKGFWVWGWAEVQGGRQNFRGWVLWDRLWLYRKDSGVQHLLNIGFEQWQFPYILEENTACFIFVKENNRTLKGVFIGYRFSFTEDSFTGVSQAGSQPRSWQRLDV